MLVARVAAVTVVAALAFGILHVRRETRRELEEQRSGLLALVGVKTRAVAALDLATVSKVEAQLGRAAAGYEGDLVADELKSPDAWRTLLAGAWVYARAELGAAPALPSVVHAAASTVKDAFVLCLLDPPEARTEAALLRKVYVAYSSHARLEPATPNVRTFSEAHAGGPFLLPEFTARAGAAEDALTVRHLRRAFEQAPVDAALDALKARLLVVVLDEPPDHAIPAELDGEKAHPVRVSIVDLTTGRVLVRLRKQVDPAWVSTRRRSEYARGLDACALAVDVRDGVQDGAAVRTGAL